MKWAIWKHRNAQFIRKGHLHGLLTPYPKANRLGALKAQVSDVETAWRNRLGERPLQVTVFDRPHDQDVRGIALHQLARAQP